MKKHSLAIVCSSFFCFTASAQTPEDIIAQAMCEVEGMIAERAMMARQGGVSLIRLMDTTTNPRHREILLAAYRAEVDLSRSFVARDFANDIMVECIATYYD